MLGGKVLLLEIVWEKQGDCEKWIWCVAAKSAVMVYFVVLAGPFWYNRDNRQCGLPRVPPGYRAVRNYFVLPCAGDPVIVHRHERCSDSTLVPPP